MSSPLVEELAGGAAGGVATPSAMRCSATPQVARLSGNNHPTHFPAPHVKQVMNRWFAVAFLARIADFVTRIAGWKSLFG